MIRSINLRAVSTSIRHCVYEVTELERSRDVLNTNWVMVLFAVNKRRGNLLALTNWREAFNTLIKTASPQPQCKEIASRMQLCRALSIVIFLPLRLAMTRKGDVLCSDQLQSSVAVSLVGCAARTAGSIARNVLCQLQLFGARSAPYNVKGL